MGSIKVEPSFHKEKRSNLHKFKMRVRHARRTHHTRGTFLLCKWSICLLEIGTKKSEAVGTAGRRNQAELAARGGGGWPEVSLGTFKIALLSSSISRKAIQCL